MDTTEFLSVFALSLILCSMIYNWIKTRNHPPGPTGIPLIGYLPFLTKMPHLKLVDLTKTYGDIFSFYIGPQHNICVSDYHMAKEILNHPMTLARPPHSFTFLVGKGGFSGMNGEDWVEQRRFTLHSIRNLGLGKGVWEKMIQEDSVEFVKKMAEGNGEPVFFEDPLAASQITNSLSLLFGRHLDPEVEKEKIQVMRTFSKLLMDHVSSVDITINVPWIAKFAEFFNFSGYQHFIKVLRKFEDIFKKEVDLRMNSNENMIREDFIGLYLKEIEKRKNDSKTTFTTENLQGNLFILFLAGQDSTVASVGWLILLMVKHPDIQKKVCDEIDHVIGRDGTVFYDDRVKLPYTTAVMFEMMRWITINPLFPPRYVLDSFEFGGYTIPQGSHIVCNSWAMLHDPRYFEDPMTFKPERFLCEDGTKNIRPDGYQPFSFGKRNCPGDGVAMMTMYLYFVTVMQRFSVKSPPGLAPDFTYRFSAGTMPKRQKLCFIER